MKNITAQAIFPHQNVLLRRWLEVTVSMPLWQYQHQTTSFFASSEVVHHLHFPTQEVASFRVAMLHRLQVLAFLGTFGFVIGRCSGKIENHWMLEQKHLNEF